MFRHGQYLEVIKVSDSCLGAVVVTVQERTMEIKNKKVRTNKWLDIEDWASVYKILQKALLRNSIVERRKHEVEGREWKKSTRRFDISYTLEFSESLKDALPMIKVKVSPPRRKSSRDEKTKVESENTNTNRPEIVTCNKNSKNSTDTKTENKTLEEYIPDAPSLTNSSVKYIPSKKSTLETMQVQLNEYTPTPTDRSVESKIPSYIPNSIQSEKLPFELYEPTSISSQVVTEEYVPNSKRRNVCDMEYDPTSTQKYVKTNTHYVPSVQTVKAADDRSNKRTKNEKTKSHKSETKRKLVSLLDKRKKL